MVTILRDWYNPVETGPTGTYEILVDVNIRTVESRHREQLTIYFDGRLEVVRCRERAVVAREKDRSR